MGGYLDKLYSGPRFTLASVMIGNLIPVLGVLFLGWDAVQILILYWVENVILGVLTVPRILAAQGSGRPAPRNSPPPRAELSLVRLVIGLFTVAFFVAHYGIFTMAHGMISFKLAQDFMVGDGGGAPAVWARTFGNAGFLWAIVAITVLNLISQMRDWWLPGKWREASAPGEMFRPYGRIIVMHVTVLVGAGVLAATHAPAMAVLLLCLLKMILELLTLNPADLRKAAQPQPQTPV